MFRVIESVYRINRTFLNNLLSIGVNPSNPKVLGDTLINWIQDLQLPYSKYVQIYTSSPPFSKHPNVISNKSLPNILSNLPNGNANQPWTLDSLFNLPALRLKYYLTLYKKLLDSTNQGKPDWVMLNDAVNSLKRLVNLIDNSTIQILTNDRPPVLPPINSSSNHSSTISSNSSLNLNNNDDKLDNYTNDDNSNHNNNDRNSSIDLPPIQNLHFNSPPQHETSPGGLTHSPMVRFNEPSQKPSSSLEPLTQRRAQASAHIQSDDSSITSDDNDDDDQQSTSSSKNNEEEEEEEEDDYHSLNRQSNDSSPPIPEAQLKALELSERLDTSRTLDIFTMQQKKCKLQIQPPALPFKRELKKSADVVLSFTPSAAPQSSEEIVMRRAHIFLLSDLFLVAERMTANEKEAGVAAPGTDMWLSFPPLSGKFLKATPNKQDNAFDLSVMKKENLTIKVESIESRNKWIEELTLCTDFAFNGNNSNNRSLQSSPQNQFNPQSQQQNQLSQQSPQQQQQQGFQQSPQQQPPFPNPPPRQFMSQFNNNQNELANGPTPAQIRPINPGMIPPPPPPFDHLQHRLQLNNPQRMNRQPSQDTFTTNTKTNSTNSSNQQFAMPSNLMKSSSNNQNQNDDSPPPSPSEIKPNEPIRNKLSAQMRCKVFLKQGHQAWKSLGSGGLKLYTQSPVNSKQLVVESDKAKALLISNYVLLDAVERVGKTGLAVEMSDKGFRTGIIYLLQLKSESSAKGLFEELIRGTHRDRGS